MSINLLQKVRTLATTPKELACFLGILGNETLPPELIPAIDVGNVHGTTTITPDPLKTMLKGPFTKEGYDILNPNLITASNLNPAFYDSLVTETELAALAVKSTKVTLIKPSGTIIGMDFAAIKKLSLTDDTLSATTKYTNGAFVSSYPTTTTSAFKSAAPVQEVGYIDFPTEVGAVYEIVITPYLESTYKTNYTLGDMNRMANQSDGDWQAITLSNTTRHLWVYEVFEDNSTTPVWLSAIAEQLFFPYTFSNGSVGVRGTNDGQDRARFKLNNPATGTTKRLTIKARIANWDALLGYGGTNYISSISSKITFATNSQLSNFVDITGWKAIVPN
jgi:hypothetical protein